MFLCDQIGSRTLNGLSQLEVLHLEDNLIMELNGDQLTNLTLLRYIILMVHFIMWLRVI
jgi:Leucine rich repeat